MKALRYSDGTVVFVEQLTFPSADDENGLSWCIVEAVETDGDAAKFPVGQVRKILARALIAI